MITIEFNDAPLNAALSRLSGLMTDFSPVTNEIGDFLSGAIKDRMAAGKAVDGSAFAPRSPATLAAYAARKPPTKPGPHPLWVTGTMRQTIAHDYGPDFARVSSNAIQAAVMHFGAAKGAFGGNTPWGNIPARPFLDASEADRSAIIDIIVEAIAAATG